MPVRKIHIILFKMLRLRTFQAITGKTPPLFSYMDFLLLRGLSTILLLKFSVSVEEVLMQLKEGLDINLSGKQG